MIGIKSSKHAHKVKAPTGIGMTSPLYRVLVLNPIGRPAIIPGHYPIFYEVQAFRQWCIGLLSLFPMPLALVASWFDPQRQQNGCRPPYIGSNGTPVADAILVHAANPGGAPRWGASLVLPIYLPHYSVYGSHQLPGPDLPPVARVRRLGHPLRLERHGVQWARQPGRAISIAPRQARADWLS